MILSAMDYVRAALAQADNEGLAIDDLQRCAEHAENPQTFCEAVNELAYMTPKEVSE